MPQKIVIKLPPNGKKTSCRALRIAVGVPGVAAAALAGENNNQIEVTGDGIDAVYLTNLLRKNVGFCELVSVGPVTPAPKPDNNAAAPQTPWNYNYAYGYGYGPGMYVIRDEKPDSCSIM